jgi:hypothetical protein
MWWNICFVGRMKIIEYFFLFCNNIMLYYKIKYYCDEMMKDIKAFFNKVMNCCKRDEEEEERRRLLAIERLWEL